MPLGNLSSAELEKPATVGEIEELKKSVAGVAEALKKSDETMEERLQATVKDILEKHPIKPIERKFELPAGTGFNQMDSKEKRQYKEYQLIKKLPIELQNEIDNMFLLSVALNKKPNELSGWEDFCKSMKEHKKALDTATSGGVSEWIPTNFSDEFFKLVRLQLKVASLFRTIQMPTKTFTFPIQIGRLKSFMHSENTADTGQTKIPVGDTSAISSNFSITAVGHGTRVLVSKDAEEDSIVPLLQMIQEEISLAIAEGREDCILNGDTEASHEDTDVTDADDRRKMWLGLRALANNQSYRTDLSTYDYLNIMNQRKNMGKYGINPAKLVLVTGIAGYIKLLKMAEVITVDKYGPGATILTGELGKIGSIPIVVSEWVREVLNASGVYQSGQTKTAQYLVYTDGYLMGERRRASTQLLRELYAESDQDALVVKERAIFTPIYPIASNRTVDLGVNFA